MDIADPQIDPKYLPEGSVPRIYGVGQEDKYRHLPSILTPTGACITRWTLTPEERDAIARGEDVYVTIWNGGRVNPMFVNIGVMDWKQWT